MTLSLSLYLLLGGLCTVLCLWTAGSAAIRVPGHPPGHRFWAFVSGSLLPPAVAATVLGTALGHQVLIPIGIVLPGLVLAGTWANVMTLREQALGLRLLHVPVLAFNVLLTGIYTVRMAQDLCGAELTVLGAAISAGYGLLQHRVGQVGAESNPVWLHLPFLLPVALSYGWLQKTALILSCITSSCLLVALVSVMPFAYHRAASYWDADPPPPELREGFTVGVQVPWAMRPAARERREVWRQQVLELGVRSVSFVVRPDLFRNRHLLQQVQEEISVARQRGLEIVAVAMPTPELLLRPVANVGQLGASMASLHWLVAEKLAPDLLVLFAGPFGQLTHYTGRPGTIDDWVSLFRDRADEVAQANPDVRVAVSLESRAPHAEEMFRQLRSADGPVDVVGLSVFPARRTMEEVQAGLDTLAQWCLRVPGEKPVRVLEVGASPYGYGGERGQAHFLQAALAFATRARGVAGATIVSLIDEEVAFGLLAVDGRRRRAWHRLRELLATRARR